MSSTSCQLGYILCGHPAIARCSMCGQAFCATHGNDELEVCRKCLPVYLKQMEKQRDLAAEERRRRVAEELNSRGRCGVQGCNVSTNLDLCQRCMTWYCSSHVTAYGYEYRLHSREGIRRMRDQISLCHSCASHLRDYEKDMY